MPLTKVNGQMLDGAITADSSGNVGIGTTSPVNNANQTSLTINGTSFGRVDLYSGGSSRAYWYAGASGTALGAVGANYVAFDTNATERMRITSGGDVGIGTSSPSVRLHVSTSSSGTPDVLWLNNSLAVGAGVGSTLVFTGTSNNNGLASISGAFAGATTADGGYMTFNTRAVTSGTLTERMRIDSSGNLGVGTLPSCRGDFRGTSGLGIKFQETSSGNSNRIELGTGSGIGYINADAGVGSIVLGLNVAGTERMRITSGGNVLVGTSTVGMVYGGIQSQPNGNTTNVPFFGCAGNSSSSSYISYGLYSTSLSQYQFYVDYNGTISARSTSITGLSDISEKENIKPLETGLNEVLALQPRRFDWKKGSGQNIAGFVAQEVETVLPDLVADYKVDETTTKKGLKMGDMIPTLVKAIQEQQTIIEELTNRIKKLEEV